MKTFNNLFSWDKKIIFRSKESSSLSPDSDFECWAWLRQQSPNLVLEKVDTFRFFFSLRTKNISLTVILSELESGHFLKVSTFAKKLHSGDYCFSLTQHSQSGEIVISIEKFNLGMAKIGQDNAQFHVFPIFQDKYFCSIQCVLQKWVQDLENESQNLRLGCISL